MSDRQTAFDAIGKCRAGADGTGKALDLMKAGNYDAAIRAAGEQVARQEAEAAECTAVSFGSAHAFESEPVELNLEGYDEFERCGKAADDVIHVKPDAGGDLLSGFTVTRRETMLAFTVTTTERVTSHRGTEFVPNHCRAKISHGEIVSLTLSKLDENGRGIDDPAGPYGAELHADFGGGQLGDSARRFGSEIPVKSLRIVREALAAIKWATR